MMLILVGGMRTQRMTYAEEAERNTLLALAHRAEGACSAATQRSLANVDEELLNFDLIENLLSYLLRTERARGEQAIVGQSAGAKNRKQNI
eukprot:7847310-Pyramimonas_sp.AAC.1